LLQIREDRWKGIFKSAIELKRKNEESKREVMDYKESLKKKKS
jgi:hypothetical protein